ncbi:MAG TPA: hypothetical protein VG146_14795 [Verrucomicrobiae bacterium]|nr:hypothetical protein [Verrucomicrobiae bacterium]
MTLPPLCIRVLAGRQSPHPATRYCFRYVRLFQLKEREDDTFNFEREPFLDRSARAGRLAFVLGHVYGAVDSETEPFDRPQW